MIGFVPAVYHASEDDGSIVFTVEVINGGLSRGLQVVVGSALKEAVHQVSIHYVLAFSMFTIELLYHNNYVGN